MKRCQGDLLAAARRLLAGYGLRVELVRPGEAIPGSFWGDSEAGLIGDTLWVRPDTPLHSLFHEACHWLCMDQGRRHGLHTDAGGDYDEENGVCYLQIVLATGIPDWGREGMMADMDGWGYSFRLGSAQAWFEQDADDARLWLQTNDLLDSHGMPTGRYRMCDSG